MAKPQDIRRRIKSIRNTAQITKAMQMVAASKMRRAQQRVIAGRPYATLMNKVLVSLQKRTDPRLHPLLHIRPLNKELVLIISTDKGLCGALNTSLFREAANFDPAKTAFVVTGKKASQFVGATKRDLLADFELKLQDWLQTRKEPMLRGIREKKQLDQYLESQLKSAMEEFKTTWQ